MQAVAAIKTNTARKRGTGSVRRFANGVWQSSFSHKGNRFFIESTSRKEAEDKLELALAFAALGPYEDLKNSLHEHLIANGYPSGTKRITLPTISSFNINMNTKTSWRVFVNVNETSYRIGAISKEEATLKYDAFQTAAMNGEFEHTIESVDKILKAANFPAGRMHSVPKPRKSGSKHEAFDNSIRLRCEGYYEGRYYYNKKSESVYAPTKKEVEKKLRAIMTSIDDGSYIGKNSETLCGYLMSWVKFASRTTLRPSTQAKYQVYIVNYFIPYFDGKKLQNITTQMLQNFFDYKKTSGRADGKEGGMAHKTLTDMKNMMTKALNYAVNPKKLILHNPAHEIVMKYRKPKQVPIMTTEQIELLIEKAMDSNNPVVWAIVILLRTGMCKGELLGLQLSKIQLSRIAIGIQY